MLSLPWGCPGPNKTKSGWQTGLWEEDRPAERAVLTWPHLSGALGVVDGLETGVRGSP